VRHRGFAPEFAFLLDAVRLARTGGALDEVVLPGLDWATIVPGIGRQGVAWIVAPLLESGIVPAEHEAALREFASRQAMTTLRLIGEARRVTRALAAADIRFLMIKGAALSVQLYGEPGRRAARDIDLVVERGKAVAVGEVLAGLGYILPPGATAPDDEGPIAKETGYVHGEKRFLVEVHDRLTDNFALLPWDFEELWAAREEVRIGSDRVPTMGRAHLPLYLCVHGGKHDWARLIWLEDLAGVLDAPEAIEAALADAAGFAGSRGGERTGAAAQPDRRALSCRSALVRDAAA
jgi:hypothetical protein